MLPKRRTTSPTFNPAVSAGPPGFIVAMIEPSGCFMPSASAISGVTCWTMRPSQLGRTQPYFSIRPITNCALLAGIAKPRPAEPVVGETSAVSIPITSPFMLNSGPPEFPWFIAASVWMKSSYGVSMMLRLSALTMPELTDIPRPSGLPMATTGSPIWSLSLSPQCATGSGWPTSTFKRATSPTRVALRTLPELLDPSEKFTMIS